VAQPVDRQPGESPGIPSYDGLLFGPLEPTPGSVVGHYHQQDDLVWADFAGGPVRTGRLVGVRDAAGVIEAAYCQIMLDGEVVAGRCLSTPTVLGDGRVRLTEQWRRADGSSGVSSIQELPPSPALAPLPMRNTGRPHGDSGATTGVSE
jgi:hypothetical protein